MTNKLCIEYLHFFIKYVYENCSSTFLQWAFIFQSISLFFESIFKLRKLKLSDFKKSASGQTSLKQATDSRYNLNQFLLSSCLSPAQQSSVAFHQRTQDIPG